MACVIGVGSPSGDDQAGWRVIDTLHALGVEALGVRLLKLDRPGTALLTQLAAEDRVVLIDAIVSGARAGSVRCIERTEWPSILNAVSSHGFGLAEALALGERLDMLPRHIELYGIELGQALPGEAPSSAVQAAVDTLARQLAKILSAPIPAPQTSDSRVADQSTHP